MSNTIDDKTLDYLIHHICLPPKLPQKDDHSMETDVSLCKFVLTAVERYRDLSPPSMKPVWDPVLEMMYNISFAIRTPNLVKESVQSLLSNMWTPDIAVLPIRAQNACVIIRCLPNDVMYECFEVDPPNSIVMGTTGRVVRAFPNTSLIIPKASLPERLQSELAGFLAQMDVDILDDAIAHSKKAGTQVEEVRDTADPHYITNLFMAILRGLPGCREDMSERLTKSTRNDILWDNAYTPWRRSPLWLIIRVAIQSTLHRSKNPQEYKHFMLFLLSDLLSHSTSRELPSDLLFCIQRKIANRLHKLQVSGRGTIPGSLLEKIRTAVEDSKEILDYRWRTVQREQEQAVEWNPARLNIEADCQLSLLTARPYILRRLAHKPAPTQAVPFTPKLTTRLFRSADKLGDLRASKIAPALQEDAKVALMDLESFVLEDLVVMQTNDIATNMENSVNEIQQCIEIYLRAAKTAYRGNPETTSIMILTTFLMWMVLDKLAIHYIPQLALYSPEVPPSLFDPLLLSKSLHLDRLSLLRTYLDFRHKGAPHGSVFEDRLKSTSFSIIYFDSSSSMIRRKAHAESSAAAAREKKFRELANAVRTYERRLANAEEHEHTCAQSKRSKKNCQKCKLINSAKGATISVHEWPLPTDPLAAKAAVFEAAPPSQFQIWRSLTYQLLYTECRVGLSDAAASSPAYVEIWNHKAMQVQTTGRSRVTFASKTKSFTQSHYGRIRVSQATEDKICVKNALDFHIYDSHGSRWITSTTFSDCTIAPLCNPPLKENSTFSAASYALTDTSHPPNQPLAEAAHHQHGGLDINQYTAYGTLRSGPQLQWLNIARELHARTLTLSDNEVQTLILQAAFQVGPYSSNDSGWHAPLEQLDVWLRLVTEIARYITDISDNWSHANGLLTAVLLITRILSSDTDPILIVTCTRALDVARTVAFRWVEDLYTQLSEQEYDDATGNRQQQLAISLVACLATYDARSQPFEGVVGSGIKLRIFIQSLILLHEHSTSNQPELARHVARIQRLAHLLLPQTLNAIFDNPGALGDAIRAIWSAYPGSHSWTITGSRWLSARMSSNDASKKELALHLDMLTGTLLIDGKPLGYLPNNIVEHPTYLRLFGKVKLHVTPSLLPGMEFATSKELAAFGGYRYHFNLSGPELIIQATTDESLLELIPHNFFNKDVPTTLTSDFHHWLSIPSSRRIAAASIDLRPLSSPWNSTGDGWLMTFGDRAAILSTRDHARHMMVDIRSATWTSIACRLGTFEERGNLHLTVDEQGTLHVGLPRYRISFRLNNGHLESSNFRGMMVDLSQSCGTLFGLQQRLVLRSTSPTDFRRSLLVPFGPINYITQDNHILVRVGIEGKTSVPYFKYELDHELRVVVSPNSLLSELYCIYLHALTSNVLPDPLLCRTGIEEALRRLASGRCKSFQELGVQEQELLGNLSRLLPDRSWYPAHLQNMQTVCWKPLSPLSQHFGYHLLVESILEYHRQLSIFSPSETGKDSGRSNLVRHLHARSTSRNYYLYSSEVAQLSSSPVCQDQVYPGPGGNSSTLRSHAPNASVIQAVSNMSALVQMWPAYIDVLPDLWAILTQLNHVENDAPTLTLSYSKRYLQADLSKLILPMYRLSQCSGKETSQGQLTVTLSALAYAGASHQLLRTILAFATSPLFRTIHLPPWKNYTLSDGTSPSRHVVEQLILRYALTIDQRPPDLVRLPGEKLKTYNKRTRDSHTNICQSRATLIAERVLETWPGIRLIPPLYDDYFQPNPTRYQKEMDDLFSSCKQNRGLNTFVIQIQGRLQVLRAASTPSLYTAPARTLPAPSASKRCCGPRSLVQLIRQRTPPLDIPRPPKLPLFDYHKTSRTAQLRRSHPSGLNSLIDEMISEKNVLLQRFGRALATSQDGLRDNDQRIGLLASLDTSHLVRRLESYLEECHQHTSVVLSLIATSLSPEDDIGSVMALVNYWPKTAPMDLLSLLSRKGLSSLVSNPVWFSIIRIFAVSLMRLQQAQRLLTLARSDVLDELEAELHNEILDDRVVKEHPDWLLIQLQGNFFGRPLQKAMAKEMIAPKEPENTLLQLNMGEGKTSVIVPLVVASLANGRNLARVVVLKPLTKSMFALLIQRLTGLANRRIFYLPVARDLRPDEGVAKQLFTLFQMCAQEGGILVAQPEHILSFKLLGIDSAKMQIQSAPTDSAGTLLSNEQWLSTYSRDVLDESDEILNVQYQLVYTTGRQIPFENHPDRWLIIQDVLSWVKEEAMELYATGITGLQIEETDDHTTFPTIRILSSQTGQLLMKMVVARCLNSGRLRLLHVNLRQPAMEFISGLYITDFDIRNLKKNVPADMWNCLLIYRGLVGLGILQFSFEHKRWRVNFGLDLKRTLLAVPYRAKDVPAIRADFGHPDVAICLTCLSYYYGGLTMEQLEICLQILLKLDNPVPTYEAWVAGYEAVPNHLRQVGGINLDDVEQRETVLYPLFRKHQLVVDFYLSRVVFPREAKQFPSKLATSSWDLAERKGNITTGFSGTNDNQDLLPTTIIQKDPLNQIGTNARVLNHLLLPENNHCRVLNGNGHLVSSKDFLEQIMKEDPPVRVLLDVGAQMLDMQSPEIAKTWLSMDYEVEAIVFFDENDRLIAMRRDLSTELLESTHYSQNLDLCAIYLDDAHTRGTDLKFPKGFRAAVTLGPNLTKDRLVQGCMRMRKLGHGHSVVFLAPLEVDNAIRALSPVKRRQASSVDIVRWAIHGTCNQIDRHLPHWAEQGVDYHKRREALEKYRLNPTGPLALTNLVDAWESEDARKLEQMYGQLSHQSHEHPAYRIPEMNRHLRKFGLQLNSGMALDEEQEREVHYEVEKERQVQRPPPAQPARHQVHSHVTHLVQTGTYIMGSPAFTPLFSSLKHLGDHEWSSNLMATKDFCTTIVGTAAESTDYLRSVHWILTLRNDPRVVVLSPFEANALLPLIQRSRKVHLHVYAPRVNESMESMEDLRFLAVPPLPPNWKGPSSVDIAQLNLWAGQLYLNDYAAYMDLRTMLGLVGEETRSFGRQFWEVDGFVPPQNRTGEMARICKFTKSPVPFLKKLLSLRQRGAPFDRTHMGKILDGQLLTPQDFK